MKKRFLITIFLVLCATASSAQVDPNPNGIGIYADLDATTVQVQVEVGTPLEVYVLLTRLSGPSMLAGFECEVVVPDNVTIWGWNLPVAGSVSISSPPAFQVGFPPVPYQAINHVMTFIVTPLDSEPALFYLKEYPNDDGITVPIYWDDSMTADPILLNPYPSGSASASFSINDTGLPADVTSWDEMKALYR